MWTSRFDLHRVMLAGAVALGPCSPTAHAQPLPSELESTIRSAFGDEARYLAGRIDLDGDGSAETIVHVVGPTSCGSGGCTTLVFGGSDGRQVGSISVSRPPILAAPSRTNGWRDLVVDVGGGGLGNGHRLLAFDGRQYPGNPTVDGLQVRAMARADGELVIGRLDSLDQAHSLPPRQASTTEAKSPPPSPSFDCARAGTPTEKTICADPVLAVLDRALATAYATAMKTWPADEQAAQRDMERAFIQQRDACSGDTGCITAAYRQRLVEVQIRGGQLEAPTAAGYQCAGHEDTVVKVAYYNQTDPKSAVLTIDDWQRIGVAEPTGSGARYAGPGFSIWEHHGDLRIERGKDVWTCRRS